MIKHLISEEEIKKYCTKKKETYTKEEVEMIIQMVVQSFVTGIILGETTKKIFKEQEKK